MTRDELDFLAEQIEESVRAEENAKDMSHLVESQEVELNAMRCRLEDMESLVDLQSRELEKLRQEATEAGELVVCVTDRGEGRFTVNCYGIKVDIEGHWDGAEFHPLMFEAHPFLTEDLKKEIAQEIQNAQLPKDAPTDKEIGF